MSTPNSAPMRRSAHPVLIALATIGSLALLIAVAFWLFVFLLTRSGVSVPVVLGGEKIGVVEVKGIISEPEAALKALREFGRAEDVRAVVVRIDSPGGAVGASQEIFQEIRRLDQKKPVVASLGTVAASGGYYAALGARRIVANPGTVTGSIGVIMKIPNVGPLLEKVGIKTTVLKSGALKDLGPTTRDLTPEERVVLEGVMHDVHRQFVDAVVESRGLDEEHVEVLADGRILSGRQAREVDLVDELGNFGVAVDLAANLANVTGELRLVYPRKDRFSLIRELLEEEGAQGLTHILSRLLQSTSPGLAFEWRE